MAKAKKKAPRSNVATVEASEVITLPSIKSDAEGALAHLNDLVGVINGVVRMQDKLSSRFGDLDDLDKEDAAEEFTAGQSMLETLGEVLTDYYKELNKVNRRVGRIIQ